MSWLEWLCIGLIAGLFIWVIWMEFIQPARLHTWVDDEE